MVPAKDFPDAFMLFKTGAVGFEPTNGGTKTRCLTTWPRPIGLLKAQTYYWAVQRVVKGFRENF